MRVTSDSRRRRSTRLPLHFASIILLAAVTCLFSSCVSPPPAYSGAFNTSVLSSTLKRGVSTEDDVVAAFGAPTGYGQASLPGTAGPRQVWVYEKTRVDVAGQKSTMNQDLLMVFIKDRRFDGYLWYSDSRKDTQWSPAAKE